MPIGGGNLAGRLVFALTADDRQFRTAMKQSSAVISDSERRFRSLQKTVRTVGRSLAAPLIGVAVLGTFRRLAGSIKEVTAEMAQLTEASRRLDFTTERLQLLGRVVEGEGGTFQGLLKGLETFQRNMGEAADGIAEYREAFDKLNVSVTDAFGQMRDSEQVFDEVVAGLQRIDNAAERTQIARDILGRQARHLINVALHGNLRDQEEAFKDLGIVTTQQAAKLKDLDQRFVNFGNTLSTAGQKMVVALEPLLTRLVDIGDALAKLAILTADAFIAADRVLPRGGLFGGIEQAVETLDRVQNILNTRLSAPTAPTDSFLRQQQGTRWTDTESPADRAKKQAAAAAEAQKLLTAQQKARMQAAMQYEEVLKNQAELAADREVAVKQFIRSLNEQETYEDRILLKQFRLKDLTTQIADLRTRAAVLFDQDQEVLAKGALEEAQNLEMLRSRLHAIGIKADQVKPILEELFTLPTVTITTPDDPIEKINHRLQAMKEVAKNSFEALNRGLSSAVVNADSFSDALRRIARLLAFEGLRAFFQPSVLRRVFTGRQTGGHMYAGTPYQVHADEVIVPRVDSTVIPAHRAVAGGAVSVTTNVYPSGDIDAAAAARLSDSISARVLSLVERARIRRAIRGELD